MILVIPMKVNTLLRSARLNPVKYNHEVSKLTCDSRLCEKNSIFVAIEGNHVNANQFIEDAIAHGAKTIITEKCDIKNDQINYIYVDNARKTLALLAKKYYKDVSRKLKIIGIIGTNGKTTTASIAYNFLNFMHISTMMIGTNGVFFSGYEANINNTTPDILTLYEYMKMARKRKISTIVMEVSSISVDQYRIFGIDFDVLIFTNFSQDHLDYHKTMDKYLYCKLIPFIKLKKTAYAIVNTDDEASKKVCKFTDAKILSYGYNKACDFLGTLNYANENGISFYSKNLLFKSKLLGEFNLYNTLSVLPLCDVFKISYLNYVAFLSNFEPVDGRMNRIQMDNKFILIDYAHTFVATQKVIEEAMRLCKGNLTIVLGCGGNREKEKRFMIGKYLNDISARIILTTDNPRFEEPLDIIHDIKSAITKEVEVIVDRKMAIQKALASLEKNDYLLILGKGCEKYMDIKGVKYSYSDLEVIHDWIRCH